MLIARFTNKDSLKDFLENHTDESIKNSEILTSGENLFCAYDFKPLINLLNKYRVIKRGYWHKECVNFVSLEIYSNGIEVEQTSVKKLIFNGTTIES